MKYHLITIGKTKSKPIFELQEYYIKLIQRLSPIKIISLNSIEKAQTFIENIKTKAFLCVLDEKGQTFKSIQFAKFLLQKENEGFSDFYIFCGSEHGYDEKFKKKCNLVLSLSPMTFPHELAVVVFIEQLYRAQTILKNQNYHNE